LRDACKEELMESAVGTVSRLWRYPVKSMLGEDLESADVIWSGLFGDRSYALVDVESSLLVSAKNPAKWQKMFECSSELVHGRTSRGAPRAMVTLPGGETFEITEDNFDAAETALSSLFGRQVRFIAARAEPRAVTMEQYHPEIEDDAQGGKTTESKRSAEAQSGTFTDSAAVHLVTTSSLRALSAQNASSKFDPLRFRPNILIDTGEAQGFAESLWVGRTLAVGKDVKLKIYKECGRCVMTTLPQEVLPADTDVLRSVMRLNGGKLGVLASVVHGGTVEKHDPVALV
jgi:uncharacterized protein